jgi:hypothetical protein
LVSETRLIGLREAQRRVFDYGCILLRDFSRPLVAQVLWSHQEGIEKDIRTLLFDGRASLKLYFVRDNVRNLARIDEILQAYRQQASTIPLLRGLRIFRVPEGFSADTEAHQKWMTIFLRKCMISDLLFAVVFGKLNPFDVTTFSDHGGAVGLKYAVLQTVTTEGLYHTPTFEKKVGSKGSPLREALTMLSATGLIGRVAGSVMRVPTLKGRFLLDLSRRIMFEHNHLGDWSDELRLIVQHLKIEMPAWGVQIDHTNARNNTVHDLIYAMICCKSQFGNDVMSDVDRDHPRFFSEFNWKNFSNYIYRVNGKYWDDGDDIELFADGSGA